jgi:hypothetical protein
MWRIVGQVTNCVLQLGKTTRELTRSLIYITVSLLKSLFLCSPEFTVLMYCCTVLR